MNSLVSSVKREPAALVAWAVLVVVFLFWIILTPNLTILSFTVTMGQKIPLAMLAIGEAIAIMSKGIDLSVGAVLTAGNVIIAAGTAAHGNSALWIAVALAVALATGLANGLCIAYLELPPLIVTLAMQSILFGVALYVLPRPGGTIDGWLLNMPMMLVGPFPLVLVLLLVIPLLFWYPMRRGPYGLALLSSGADRAAAYGSGINVRSTVVRAYVLSGFFAGLAGVFVTMNTGSGDPTIGASYTLNAIAACVVGGVALSGGRGTVIGPVAGALLISFVANLLFSMGVNPYWQYVVTGAILVLAIAVPLVGSLVRRGNTA